MTFHSPGPDNQDKVKSNPYTEGAGGDAPKGNTPASAGKSGVNQPGAKGKNGGKKARKQARANEAAAKRAGAGQGAGQTAQAGQPAQKPAGNSAKAPAQPAGQQAKPGQSAKPVKASSASNAKTAEIKTTPAAQKQPQAAQGKKPAGAEVASGKEKPEGIKTTATKPAQKPGMMAALRESARTVDPEERRLAYINPMSALKLGFTVNVCLLVILLVASIVMYAVLGLAGVWDNLNSLLGDLTGMGSFGIGQYLTIVLGVGLLEVVVFTLLAPVMAIMYNLAAKIVGGLSVTVSGVVDGASNSAGNGTVNGAVNDAANGVRKVN